MEMSSACSILCFIMKYSPIIFDSGNRDVSKELEANSLAQRSLRQVVLDQAFEYLQTLLRIVKGDLKHRHD